jgi:hypothetical protein
MVLRCVNKAIEIGLRHFPVPAVIRRTSQSDTAHISSDASNGRRFGEPRWRSLHQVL